MASAQHKPRKAQKLVHGFCHICGTEGGIPILFVVHIYSNRYRVVAETDWVVD